MEIKNILNMLITDAQNWRICLHLIYSKEHAYPSGLMRAFFENIFSASFGIFHVTPYNLPSKTREGHSSFPTIYEFSNLMTTLHNLTPFELCLSFRGIPR